MVPQLDVIRKCARRRLHRLSGAGSSRLANDVSLVLCGIRTAVLWDFTNWEPPLEGGLPSPPEGFLHALVEAAPCARALALLSVGESLFLIHAATLTRKLQRSIDALEVHGDEHEFELIAVDGVLCEPRACNAIERCGVLASFKQICHIALPQLQALDEAGGTTARPLVRCACPSPAQAMVAVHGWLLEFPVIYCYVSEADMPAGNASCLGGQSLSVLRVEARRAAGEPPHEHSSWSFSMPACAQPLQRASVVRWHREIEARFAAQTGWCLCDVHVEVRTEENVVL
jgi:hypothetical protein